jgi:DNA-directed RNA polymerase specialized sigma24 family protein
MTNQQHPITPPPELVEEWASMLEYHPDEKVFSEVARWGADQELEACLERILDVALADQLRDARRPKPPSLKEQALAELEEIIKNPQSPLRSDTETIRRALEALPND